MRIEISSNRRLAAIRVMLGLEKRQMIEILGTIYHTYNNVEMERKDIPHSWLKTLHSVYNINTNWILHEEGKVLC